MNQPRDIFFVTRSLFVIVLLVAVSCISREGPETATGSQQNQPAIATDSLAEGLESFVTFSPTAATGANVYVPVYSHIYQLNQRKTFNLTATLSIRNTDLRYPLSVKKVYYYDSKGELVHKYLDSPQSISPLSSTSFVVEEEDLRGGVGANFLVLWESERRISKPVIEAVMISTSQQQGISFVSEGRVLHDLNRTTQ